MNDKVLSCATCPSCSIFFTCFEVVVYSSNYLFFKILLTHEGSHREVYRDFQPSLTLSARPVSRVVQTTGSVHPQPILPNCQLCINTEPTTSIGRLIKYSRL